MSFAPRIPETVQPVKPQVIRLSGPERNQYQVYLEAHLGCLEAARISEDAGDYDGAVYLRNRAQVMKEAADELAAKAGRA